MKRTISLLFAVCILLTMLSGCTIIRHDKITDPDGVYTRCFFLGWPVYSSDKVFIGQPWRHRGEAMPPCMCPRCRQMMERRGEMMEGGPGRPEMMPPPKPGMWAPEPGMMGPGGMQCPMMKKMAPPKGKPGMMAPKGCPMSKKVPAPAKPGCKTAPKTNLPSIPGPGM